MARFDFIESAASGYRFLIREHRTIYHLGLIPFLVKLASFALISMIDPDMSFARQGLILLPSYFLEGWLVAHLIRLAVLGESPAQTPPDAGRNRALKASMIIYVLIKMAASVSAMSAMSADSVYKASESQEPSVLIFFAALGAIVFLVWAFRLMWIYVPAALGMSIVNFLRAPRAFAVSAQMMATWFLCFIPVALLLLMSFDVLSFVFPAPAQGQPSPMYTYVLVLLQGAADFSISIVSSIAIAYGIGAMYKIKPHDRKP